MQNMWLESSSVYSLNLVKKIFYIFVDIEFIQGIVLLAHLVQKSLECKLYIPAIFVFSSVFSTPQSNLCTVCAFLLY